MSRSENKQIAGARGEVFVFGELLKRGTVSYLPLVDEGFDALVRSHEGHVIEVQITSAGSAGGKYHRWFQMPKFEPRKKFFILGVEFIEDEPRDVWVLPSMVFDKYANRPVKGTPRDLDLDSGIRKHGMPLRDLLCGFRNRWELLLDYEKYEFLMDRIEDLEDILTMKEAREAPENESVSLEEYERSRKANLRD